MQIRSFKTLPALLLSMLLSSVSMQAQAEVTEVIPPEAKLLAKFEKRDAAELDDVLTRAENAFLAGGSYPKHEPIQVVIYDDTAAPFVDQAYSTNKDLVDKAAKLDALGVVDVSVCGVWVDVMGLQRTALPGFVRVVPNGPFYEKELERKGYQHF